MSHEIETKDNVVLHKTRAWHGLGVVLDEAVTPREALPIIGADFGLGQRSLCLVGIDGKPLVDENGMAVTLDSHVANVREDETLGNGAVLGVVRSSYQPISNAEAADFCEALQMNDSPVKVETAGTIRNGKRIWFLLKGESFEVGSKGDEVFPYVLISNGHDGGAPFRVTPTTIRVVCSNTLHMVIPRSDTGELGASAIAIRHTKNAMERVEEAKLALKHYSTVLEKEKEIFAGMAKKDVTEAVLQKFFAERYSEDFQPIPLNPKDAKEERRAARAKSAWELFHKRFDDEKEMAGASLWNAANAYSGLIQHDMKARGKDDGNRVQRRIESNLLGLNQRRAVAAFKAAYAVLN